MDIRKLKKVELHVHLDGSVKVSTFADIMEIDEDLARKMSVAGDDCKDLNDYLSLFDTPIMIMQTADVLTRVAEDLVDSFIHDNVIYAEVRFAPNKHTINLSLDEVVDAVLDGLKSEKVKVNLILCMMRGDTFEDNKKIIELAYKYYDYGVVGVDLAGAEAIYKTEDYKELFNYASSLGIPFTIHAGEADGINSINSAVSFGATRIGHGVRAIESENCMNTLKENDILLEVCPTSNIETKVCSSISNHPIKKLFDYGVKVSINTDNRTVSNITLNDEYELLEKTFHFTERDFNNMNVEAIKHAFINDIEKLKLINKIRETN